MTKKIECPTCQGESTIYERRVDNRDEQDFSERPLDEKIAFIKTLDSALGQIKNGSKYLYDCKIPYDDSAKDLIKQLRKSGHKIRVRGSGERAKWSLIETNGLHGRKYDSHLPLKYASHVRLYITK